MGNHSIQVSCRVRASSDVRARPCISIGDDARTILVQPTVAPEEKSKIATSAPPVASSAYSCFDNVFSDHATQETVFERIGRPMVDDLLQGYNCTVLAYGQTGSGKTFTTVGDGDSEVRGLVPRAIEAICEELQRIDGSEWDVALTASFTEVHQESLRDLLLPYNSRHLKVREDKDGDVFVDGASAIQVASGLSILARGTAQRATGATLMNTESSRSHAVFMLAFTKRSCATHVKLRGKLLLVDLAGSEKTRKTAASGKRLDEAKYINRSLSALGNVINALTDGKPRFVPYRDSKLTRLLQSSLGGNAKTHLMLTCSSSYAHVDETLSTLRFGARAKSILNAPHVNNEKTTSGTEYKTLLATLRKKIESLCRYIQQLEARKCEQCRATSRHVSSFSIEQSREKHDGHGQSWEVDDPADDNPESPGTPHSVSSTSATRLSDDIMQEEINSLRRTIAEMQCDRHEFEHARLVANALIAVRKAEEDALHHHRLTQLQQEQADLEDANSSSSQLRQEASHLQQQLAQWEQGQSAEAEILRRRLDLAEKQAQRAQLELLASQQLQTGKYHIFLSLFLAKAVAHALGFCFVLVELRASVTAKEQELRQLGGESNSLRAKLVSALTTGHTQHSSAHRFARSPTQLGRPVTAFEVTRDCGTPSVVNIQSWWSGSPSDPTQQSPDGQQLEEPSGFHSSPLGSQLLERRRASAITFVGEEAAAACSRQMALDERRCRSQGQAHRPLRARLVGLLNSLEEETSSLREMIDMDLSDHLKPQPRPVGAKAGRARMQLPCLETISS